MEMPGSGILLSHSQLNSSICKDPTEGSGTAADLCSPAAQGEKWSHAAQKVYFSFPLGHALCLQVM